MWSVCYNNICNTLFTKSIKKHLYFLLLGSESSRRFAPLFLVLLLIVICAVVLIAFIHHSDETMVEKVLLNTNVLYKLAQNSDNLNKLLETLMSLHFLCCMPGACNSQNCMFSMFTFIRGNVSLWHEFSLNLFKVDSGYVSNSEIPTMFLISKLSCKLMTTYEL